MIPIHTSAPRPRETPIIVSLLAVMTLVFFYQQMLSPWENQHLIILWGFIPAVFSELAGPDPSLRDWLRPVTAAFLHGGWFHFLVNAWIFWLFGRAVEGALGSKRMLGLFLAAAVLANLAHLMVYPGDPTVVIGASGAISGIIGAHMRLFPHARVLIVVPIIVVPIWFRMRAVWFVAVWLGIQLVQGLGALSDPAAGGAVAWWVHIGGFAVGFLAAPALGRGAPLRFEPTANRAPTSPGRGAQDGTWQVGPWGSRPRQDDR
jgi:membrane associated rhomboid family serine protease